MATGLNYPSVPALPEQPGPAQLAACRRAARLWPPSGGTPSRRFSHSSRGWGTATVLGLEGPKI